MLMAPRSMLQTMDQAGHVYSTTARRRKIYFRRESTLLPLEYLLFASYNVYYGANINSPSRFSLVLKSMGPLLEVILL